MTILNPEAIGDPDQTPILRVSGSLAAAVEVNGRIHVFREALGDDSTHPLTPNLLAGIAAKPDVASRVLAVFAQLSGGGHTGDLASTMRARYEAELDEGETHAEAIVCVLDHEAVRGASDAQLGAVARVLLALEDET